MHTPRLNLRAQIILRLYDSPAEVLLGFDIDCACCGYDGTAVWVLPRCVRALTTCTNVLNPLHAWPVRCAYEFRLAKYAWRGFAIAVPGLDLGKVDHALIASNRVGKLSGLARLLRISNALQYGSPSANGSAQGQQPVLLNYNPDIAAALAQAMDDDEFLACRGGGGYADATEGLSVILPSCFEHDGFAWWGMSDLPAPPARDIREEAWRGILDAGDEHSMLSVPRKLLEAWDNTRRSREYAAVPRCHRQITAKSLLPPPFYEHRSLACFPAALPHPMLCLARLPCLPFCLVPPAYTILAYFPSTPIPLLAPMPLTGT